MRARSRLLIAFLAAAAAAPASASGAGLIAAYDRYETGKGFELGLVNVSTGATIALPAGVNTPADELHPALSSNGRILWFVRTQLQPTLSGDVPIPEGRTLVRLNRSTGAVTVLGDLGNAGFGAMFTNFGKPTLSYGVPWQENPVSTTRSFFGIARTVNATSGEFGSASEGVTIDRANPSGSEIVETTQMAQEIAADGSIGDTYLSTTTFNATTGRVGGSTINVFQGNNFIVGGQGPAHHAAPRPGDGYVAYTSNVGARADIRTLDPPSATSPFAPSPITTGGYEGMPAWSPDLGKHLGWVGTNGSGSARILRAYDTTPGIQAVVLPSVNLGALPPTTQLREFQEIFGGIALALDNTVAIPTLTCGACAARAGTSTQLSPIVSSSISGQAIGIFIARVTGSRTLLGRTVPKIKPIGRVPLGATKTGRNSFDWDGRVEGKKLKPGDYLLTYRALQKDEVVATSGSVRFKVGPDGRPKGFKKL